LRENFAVVVVVAALRMLRGEYKIYKIGTLV